MIKKKLILGKEYSQETLADIFYKPEIKGRGKGILRVDDIDDEGSIIFLFHTLDNRSTEDDMIPGEVKKMLEEDPHGAKTTEAMAPYRHDYCNFFIKDQKRYEWDIELDQKITDSIIKDFKNGRFDDRYLLFARLEKYRDYVYCGPITYSNHYDAEPPRIISSFESVEEEFLSDSLQELYDYEPNEKCREKVSKLKLRNKNDKQLRSKLDKDKYQINSDDIGDFAEHRGKEFYKSYGFDIINVHGYGQDFTARHKKIRKTRVVEVKGTTHSKRKTQALYNTQVGKSHEEGVDYDLFVLQGIETNDVNKPYSGSIHLEMNLDAGEKSKTSRSKEYTLKDNQIEEFKEKYKVKK